MSENTFQFPPVDHAQWNSMVARLRAAGKQLYIVTTGATGGLLSALWRVPGASKNLLGFRFCYANEELVDFLGKPLTGSFVSDEMAAKMAAHAYWHGRELAYRRGIKNLNDVVGVGMTAAVATDRNRRGADRVCIAVATSGGIFTYEANFPKPERGESLDHDQLRHWQGETCDLLTLNAILKTVGVQQIGIPQVTRKGWRVESNQLEVLGSEIPFVTWGTEQKFYRFETTHLDKDNASPTIYGWINWNQMFLTSHVEEWSSISEEDAENFVLYPGSFDPLTHGHIGVAKMIEQMTGKYVVFEITNQHPNKGFVSDADMLLRAGQFTAFAPVILSRAAPLYRDKARLYPHAAMIVGADALMQLLNERHYGGYQGLCEALDEFVALGTTFYVVGRVVGECFLTLNDIPIMAKYRHLFHDVSYRQDISSTEIRKLQTQA